MKSWRSYVAPSRKIREFIWNYRILDPPSFLLMLYQEKKKMKSIQNITKWSNSYCYIRFSSWRSDTNITVKLPFSIANILSRDVTFLVLIRSCFNNVILFSLCVVFVFFLMDWLVPNSFYFPLICPFW